ncbi:MAG: DNA methyltransferase, partial [Myxococcota bacterium]
GDVILDPFGGAATTGVAALRLGRRVVVIEQRNEWAQLCRDRLEAEARGLDLAAARRGQLGLFDWTESL